MSNPNSFINKTEEEIEATISAKEEKAPGSFTVATLPDAAANIGRTLYCSDGAAGSPSAVISDGTNWKVAGTLGATAATE
jgi:hypothetical protein